MNIPALTPRWPSRRARNLFREINDRGHDLPLASVTRDGGVEFRTDLDISVWNPGENTSAYKRVIPGDFVIGLRSFQSGIGYSPLEGLVSPAYTVLRPTTPDVGPGYFRHLFKSDIFISRLENIAQGIRQGRTVATEDFNELRLPVPPQAVQRAIADYLDRETARIDGLIVAKGRVAALLKQRMQLTAYAQTTADGDELPLRRLLRSLKTGGTPPSDKLEYLQDGDLPWYSPADIGEWLGLSGPERTLKSEAVADGVVPEFPPESTLLVGIGATAGKVAFLDHPATGNQQLTCLVAGTRLLPRFLAWQLFARRDELRATAPFTTLPILNNEFVRSVVMVAPSLATQTQIADRLDDEARQTSALIQRETRHIALLRERRQALITAAVTGQLDIPEAARAQ